LSFLTLKSPRARAFVEAKEKTWLSMITRALTAFFGALAGVFLAACGNAAL
jgi:hypothetical protein